MTDDVEWPESIMSDKNRAWRVTCGVRVLDFLVEIHNEIEQQDLDRADIASKMNLTTDQLGELLAADSTMTARQIFMLADVVNCKISFEWAKDTE